MSLNDDFIKIYDNVLDKQTCQILIDLFEQNSSHVLYPENSQERKDMSFNLGDADPTLNSLFSATLNEIALLYKNSYTTLDNQSLKSFTNKVQRTKPSEGYHKWHTEKTDLHTQSRVLVWLLYLNDIEEGGETEYLYLNKRVKPKQGTLIIHPAGFTHLHRGNPPLKETKYVVTGWYNLTE